MFDNPCCVRYVYPLGRTDSRLEGFGVTVKLAGNHQRWLSKGEDNGKIVLAVIMGIGMCVDLQAQVYQSYQSYSSYSPVGHSVYGGPRYGTYSTQSYSTRTYSAYRRGMFSESSYTTYRSPAVSVVPSVAYRPVVVAAPVVVARPVVVAAPIVVARQFLCTLLHVQHLDPDHSVPENLSMVIVLNG